ncbi:hypothetical protein DB43_BG00010 [Parachlamydia acanthamoebae]|uniref:Uncharacterized protein n=1 Tax=Parachlamydia acanthamoebae TaxID=83552 RepID=A0A0C1E7H0_9BACT|nr:hypothetical protein DB43_BG00010 [Parachlamydia acanthamoebae]
MLVAEKRAMHGKGTIDLHVKEKYDNSLGYIKAGTLTINGNPY